MPNLGGLKEAIRPYYLRWVYFPLRPGKRPASFHDCWRYPFQKIGAGSVPLPESPSDLPYLLFYPMTDWHARIQRTQHLVQAFATRGFPCIYINPHLGRQFETTALFDRPHRLAQLGDNIFELHVRLPREPVFHDRMLTAAEEEILTGAIRRILPRRASVIQLASFPLWLGVARRFRSEASFPIIYDCHDLLCGFQKVCRSLLAAEEELLQEANLVLFSSQGLADRHAHKTARSLLVRNAVSPHTPVATGLRGAGPATAGYVGALDSWFDIEAVWQAASQNPMCRFVLAGRIEFEPINRLRSLPNVELVGEVPYDRVPGLMAEFRVALIPFALTPLTLMTNPIKIYEYFSHGLPVVSSRLPEAVMMGDLVYLASTPSDFAGQVRQALREDDPSLADRRKAAVARESWKARVEDIQAQFEALLLSCNV